MLRGIPKILGQRCSVRFGSFETIALERRGPLSVLRLNRPERMNAINPQMYNEIASALNAEAENAECSMVALTGAGKYYSSGNDLAVFAKALGGGMTPPEMADMAFDIMIPFVDAFIDFPKPLVAVVNGPAIGIGCSHLGLCDLVFAEAGATFVTPFTALGQSAEACSSYTFPKIMGPAAASEMILFNERISAATAKDAGLVGQTYAKSDEQKVWDKIETYSQNPAKSLLYSKALVRTEEERAHLKKVNRAEGERLRERWASEDCFNAIANFMSRKH